MSDDGEWDDEPVHIESRPSGMQVISARLPSPLAEELLALAYARSVPPSVLIREAASAFLHPPGPQLSATSAGRMRVLSPLSWCGTENANLVTGARVTSATANLTVTP